MEGQARRSARVFLADLEEPNLEFVGEGHGGASGEALDDAGAEPPLL